MQSASSYGARREIKKMDLQRATGGAKKVLKGLSKNVGTGSKGLPCLDRGLSSKDLSATAKSLRYVQGPRQKARRTHLKKGKSSPKGVRMLDVARNG